jgi:hypothetical protein
MNWKKMEKGHKSKHTEKRKTLLLLAVLEKNSEALDSPKAKDN